MATWKKVIDDTDKLSNLSDVHANGSANGQTLIYDAGNNRYDPAVVTGGTYLTETVGAGTLSIDMSNQDALDRLETLTGSEIVVGANSQNGNSYPMDLNGSPVRLNSSKLHGNNDANLEIQAFANKSMQLKVKKTGGGYVNAIEMDGAGERVLIGSGSEISISYGSPTNLQFSAPTTVTNLFKPEGGVDTQSAAVDWDLIDDNPSAISFDSTAATGILEIVTSDGAEKVKMSKDLEVTGDLIVQGDSTTLNTATLSVEDKVVVVANTGSPTTTTGDNAGLQVETSATSANDPTFKWHKDAGGGNTDGAGTANGLTGWKVANAQTSAHAEYAVAIMDYKTDANAPTNNSAGVGAFCLNTNDDALYIRTD